MRLLIVFALLVVSAVAAPAADWTVNLESFTFNPTPLTINLNDTVTWVWLDGGIGHSTTSDSGQLESWDSGVHSQTFSFQHTFTHVGDFRYHCSVHGGPNGQGMSGIVSVVPEPGSMMVLGSAMLTLFGCCRGRRLRRR